MGATYTRQSASAIVDGGIIEAADLNAEFNQLLAAFAVSSGHTHDGTAAEGGPITKLLGTAITIGDGTAGTDIAVTFDGETGDGVLTWMEDEDYFQFSDDLLLTTTEKLQFRDTAIYINSSADGQLDLVADTEIQIAATTIDINGAVALNGAITGATNITLSGELDAATLDISGDADIDGTLETDALSINGTAVTSTAAELNLVDGITAGTVSASLAVIVDSNKDISGFRNVTLTGELDAATLDISGDADIDGTLEADAITVNGATLTEFITDAVGGMVSSNTETGITVTFEDGDNTLDFALGSSQTTISSLTNTSLVVGRDADNDIDFATDNNIIFRAAGADQIVLKDGVLEPVTDDDVALGTSGSKRFTNLFLSGSITAGANANITGHINTNGNIEIDVASGDPTIIFDTQGADKFHIAVDDSDSDNLVIKSGGTVGSGNGLKLDSSGNLIITGDLTVSGDDLTMGTNTDTAIMVADGTNFNPVVPSGDVTLTNAGVFGIASGVIVNADINSSAAIADSKLDTISTANKVSLAALDIDGGTDIGEAIVDADLFIVDNGAGGTNRKVAASRLITYVDANSSAASVGKAIAMAIVFG